MAKITLKNIDKIYPNGVQAVFDFNLDIEDGEFIVLVGPSGCGKSTTLRMVAGLESITAGEFKIDEKLANDLAPVDRDIAMVFQNYALYSHMTVYENVGISMRINHEDKIQSHLKIKDAAEKLELTNYLNRLTNNLSGGQRQRVALGRTIVRQPKMFLMDEPLSNLDAKLREKTRSEIVDLQKELGITTLYVTHDQIEAMTMADRMVVMKDGYVQQIGTPFDIYSNPTNMFVASFIGIPTMNFIEGKIEGDCFVVDKQKFNIPSNKLKDIKSLNGKEVVMGVRPEFIKCNNLFFSNNNYETLELDVDFVEFLGSNYELSLNFNGQKVVAKVDARDYNNEQKLKVMFDLSNVHFFDKETTNKISEV
ncbi:MAG: sn-glycerol-3-phosphate ABC transporter ATP-binding protein UgpC [bacterium]